jgi:predicted nucleic acid-binding protein
VTIVIDTNIIISAILSDKGEIGELLMSKTEKLEFFAPEFLLDELNNHQAKIKSITGFNDDEYERVMKLVLKPSCLLMSHRYHPVTLIRHLKWLKMLI